MSTRRDFLKKAGGLALLTIVPRSVLGGTKFVAPSDQLTKGIIGVGGIMSPADAKAMLDAGADLLQLYTGYIYEGPGLVGEICRSLIADAEAAAAAKAAAEARAEEEARAAAQAAEAKAAAATASGAQAPEAGKAAPGTETAATAQTQAAAPAESVPNPSPETQNSPAQPADNEPDTRKKQPAS